MEVTQQAVLSSLEDYYYDLPQSLIAQEPAPRRGDSRLLVLHRGTGEIAISSFSMLGGFLPPRSLLVLNNAKVTPSRLYAANGEGRVEVLILNPPVNSMRAGAYDLWCMGYPGRKLKIGKELVFEGGDCRLFGKVIDISPNGQRLVRFNFSERPLKVLERLGHLPLPPYIKRPDRKDDFERYQTVYAKEAGAVAAPTAGLHFTREHLKGLLAGGFGLAYVHLRVGAGTFLPLTEDSLSRGALHEEFVEVEQEAADQVNLARREGRAVVAVGTTAVRALEWASRSGVLEAKRGYTDMFIRPGFEFQEVDSLVTNFHLPGSSLLMLVSAFAGLFNIKKAYELAVREEFRFFSYGDAMLIL